MRGLDTEAITLRQALRRYHYQALQLDDASAHQALSRLAAVTLLQMRRADQATPGGAYRCMAPMRERRSP